MPSAAGSGAMGVLFCCRWNARDAGDPFGVDDLAVMVVAGGVGEHVALAFVEVVEGQRVGHNQIPDQDVSQNTFF